jgi:hypothetical protein
MALAVMAAALSAITFAQDPQERTAQMAAELRAAAETRAQAVATLRSAVETRITPGRPYAAEAVNEFVQMLADGNRISRSSTTKVFRDTEGRTRRETEQSISINDPVAHVSYVLDPVKRTAVKAQIAIAYPSGRGVMADKVTAEQAKVEQARRREVESRARGGAPVAAPVVVEPVMPGARGGGGGRGGRSGPGEVKSESLGQKMIEGVMADGTRTTTVIAAGAIGNAQPITIVSEQWFSEDLQVLVLTRHSDPRSGESTYRLTGIVRAEPDRSLFEVPPDYTVKEQGNRLFPVLQER